MKFSDLTKDVTPLEIGGGILILLYLIFPVPTPLFLNGIADSPIGIGMMLLAAVFLFFYVNPIISILFVFAVYELLRRMNNNNSNSNAAMVTTASVPTSVSQAKKDEELIEMNKELKTDSLEVDMITNMSPIGKSEPVQFLPTSYKPVSESIGSASTY
uniref:Uncharacterized protein n=1 Tax=viral metagenome TaxID=1070528 RepID=A0A6C0I3E3_9ZZZZ